MPDRSLVSTFIAGDPVRVDADVTSLAQLTSALGLAPAAGLIHVAPGVALVVAPAFVERTSLVCCQLAHETSLQAGEPLVVLAFVLVTPRPVSIETVRLVARLRGCLRDSAVVAAARRATTRADLVRLLAPAERNGSEGVLTDDELLVLLGSAPGGLTAAEAARRLDAWGPNRLERVARRPLGLRLLAQFTSFFALLLWVGGGLAFLAGLAELGWAVFVVIVVNGLFSFWQEYRAERSIEALQRLLPQQVVVLRDGTETAATAERLVAGDVVLLEEGQQVPADGQLLDAAGLRIDQGALTGESHPVWKMPARKPLHNGVPRLERPELVFAGTGVAAGQGRFVVTSTAMATEIGAIARLTKNR